MAYIYNPSQYSNGKMNDRDGKIARKLTGQFMFTWSTLYISRNNKRTFLKKVEGENKYQAT